MGKVYLQAVADTYGSYAFGFLHTDKLPDCATAVLHNDVLPFYRRKGIAVSAVLTYDGREFRGTDTPHTSHILPSTTLSNDAQKLTDRRRTDLWSALTGRCWMSSFVEVSTEVLRALEDLQADLDDWLRHYNSERPHRGVATRKPANGYHPSLPQQFKRVGVPNCSVAI